MTISEPLFKAECKCFVDLLLVLDLDLDWDERGRAAGVLEDYFFLLRQTLDADSVWLLPPRSNGTMGADPLIYMLLL